VHTHNSVRGNGNQNYFCCNDYTLAVSIEKNNFSFNLTNKKTYEFLYEIYFMINLKVVILFD